MKKKVYIEPAIRVVALMPTQFIAYSGGNDDVIVDPKPDDGDGRSRIFGWGEDDE